MIALDAELGDRSFTLSRIFDAPVPLVFRLWTDPAYVSQWWGIKGSTAPVCELDVQPGGTWRIDMRTASGRIYHNQGTYLEVVDNQRLVYTDVPDRTLTEWQGHPPGPGLHTVNFRAMGEKTLVTLDVQFSSSADRDRMLQLGMREGIGEGLDRLEQLLASL